MDRVSKDYKQAIDEVWGPIANKGVLGQNPSFQALKKTLLDSNHVTMQSCTKSTLFPNKSIF